MATLAPAWQRKDLLYPMNWNDYRTKLPARIVQLIETDFPRLQETGVINLSREERLDTPRTVRWLDASNFQQRTSGVRTTKVTVQALMEEPGFIGTAKYYMTNCAGVVSEAWREEGVDVEYNPRYDTSPKDFVLPSAQAEKTGLNVVEGVDSCKDEPQKLSETEERFAGILFEDEK